MSEYHRYYLHKRRQKEMKRPVVGFNLHDALEQGKLSCGEETLE